MESETRKINKSLMFGWSIIVLTLLFTYIGEYLKGVRTLSYITVFLLCTIAPNLYCLYQYQKKKDSEVLRYYIVAGYFIMYLFSMTTGSTNMVFSYILPLLSLLVLYHQPKLILWTGIASLIVNLFFIGKQFLQKGLTLENSKDIEIQLALIILCFGGCYIATRIYDKISRQNVEFFEQLKEKNRLNQQMTLQTIMTIVNAIDAKDEYTRGHSQRVSEYSALLAAELGASPEEIEHVRYAALLHDIGKIGVPDAILNKSGKLTKEEFSLMKLHTLIGAEILKDIKSVPDLDVGARYHHERYDGTGYPEGLRGNAIPYTARIIGIADSYDAMTSNRIYRKRLTDEDVEGELLRFRGTQFDPEITDAFLKLLREKRLSSIQTDIISSQDTAQESVANQVLQKIIETNAAYLPASQKLDTLTSVYTKAYGVELVNTYLTHDNGCLLVIDLDSLRRINGQHGFIRGDLYLNTIANILSAFYTNTILYRSDGDEFVCFLCGLTDSREANSAIHSFYERLRQEKEKDNILMGLSVSIGAVLSSIDGRNSDELFSKANKALYFAKQKGPNSFCMYHELQGNQGQNLSHLDLNNLIQMIHEQEAYSNAYQINYPEFARIVSFIKKIVERNEQQMQIILFTVIPADEEIVTIEEKIAVMEVLKRAVVYSLRSVDVTTQFSSYQRIAILMDLSKENIEIVTNRIISSFYKMNTDKNFSIGYDVADLAP